MNHCRITKKTPGGGCYYYPSFLRCNFPFLPSLLFSSQLAGSMQLLCLGMTNNNAAYHRPLHMPADPRNYTSWRVTTVHHVLLYPAQIQ